ncbi:hypothetical protein TVAG_462300 [Trichomonas vaginalis G3]|uniref:Rhodanese domain-containing protein n=1 Tax=Trichomonas vaginalis (strain ATCC PRA-98 / G3) TaxID=412133 RepID=A2DLU2_TRIV3|nr:rhodanese/cell cycle control phosphatase family [Trichomonas vaginalis G3]EAY18545.1 hypothetical protein TVAG_462300 [Trichomonas vaginalis G3]KAI5491568.1 rhodanese/cell cycle control phosphatase family [Trichomonas vaginalis G3]|eukprot:XP_001579531.1 hypothetical protein [Trichomonas vaginalis G3]
MYAGGIKAISPKGLIDLIKGGKKLKILDVRDVDFGEHAVIKNAIHLPLNEHTETNISKIVDSSIKEKIDKMVCYCHTGPRSVFSADLIKKEMKTLDEKPNFDVEFLKGGILGFIETEGYREFVE